ncbi:MAG: hypothetical protein IJR63_06355 [Synergistaceae bacterium]|nr:hypothetical protein [Synergistaceae bacterium]
MNTYLTIFGKPRYLGFADIDTDEGFDLERPKWAVIRTSRGYEMGLPGGIVTPEQQEMYRRTTAKFDDTSEAMLQDVEFVREADAEDIENYYNCRHEEEEALLVGRDILAEYGLNMKLVDVEYMLDRRRLYFYFTATQRVDFREYVRELAYEFRTRIEMRQIGSRDEARIVQGIASCGRPCCCGYWLRGFSSISIRIVKEQRSALNPTKISGICGRLMCCMSYEKELYSELWSKLPGPGTKIKTERGIYTLESLDVGQEQVNIRFPTGRLIPVAISEFPDFRDTVLRGEEWGEDKELAEKKRKAAERIAAIKARSERLRASRVSRSSAKPPKTRSDSPDSPNKPGRKPRPKPRQAKPAGESSPKPKPRRHRKPNPPKPEE